MTQESQPPKSNRAAMIALVAAVSGAVAAGAGIILLRDQDAGAKPGQAGVISHGTAAIGGPFHLIDQDGKAADERILRGKWTAVFFGYTYCPDICPLNLQILARAQEKLGAKAKDFQVVFVSVDPQRDTAQTLKTYLSNQGFPKGAIGLTGTPAQVAEAAKAYRIYYARQGKGSDYLMDHTAVTYLMDPQGRFYAPIAASETPDQVAAKVSAAMGS